MYQKYLVSFLAALSLTTLYPKTSVRASNIANYNNHDQEKSQTCNLTNQVVHGKKNSKINKISEIDFAKHLKITTSGSKITANFAPLNQQKQLIKLDELAKLLGYKSFDWVNYVVNDPHGIRDHHGQPLSTPYNDPPAGGYEYGAADNHPFYWDIETCQNCLARYNAKHPRNQQRYSLTFEDNPTDYRLQKGESVNFVTHLVGRKISKSPQDNFQWDVLSTFSWELTNSSTGVGKVTLISRNDQTYKPSSSLLTRIKEDGGNFSSYALC